MTGLTKDSAGLGGRNIRRRDNAYSGWAKFGWQGISGLVPADWNLGAIGGDFKKGYLRLDDPERPRLEIKWNEKEADIDRALDRYLKTMSRSRRGPVASAVQRDIKLISSRLKGGKRIIGFSWEVQGEVAGAGVIWYCKECGRTLFGQVTAAGKGEALDLAAKVFAALEDHAKKGRFLWAAYGLECELPEAYSLLTQKLMSGQIEFNFQGKGRNRLRVARWGLAATMLQGIDLQQWFLAKGVAPKSEIRWEAHDKIIKNHAGLEVRGDPRRPVDRIYVGLRRAVKSLVTRKDKKKEEIGEGTGYLWHCPESNRIYIVESVYGREDGIVQEVADSITCH